MLLEDSKTRRLEDPTRRKLVPLGLFFVFALAAFGTIRSYDLFWQLATGRWIVEHRALPAVDPFALASEKSEWIDGEWLYEIALYGMHAAVGVAGLSVVRSALAALIFTIAFVASRRESGTHGALLASAIGFAGAMAVLDLRPSGVAALMVVLMLTFRSLTARAALTVLWMNVHPSALLAPLVGARRSWRGAMVCALALFANPYGWKGIVAPLRLTAFVQSGAFVNAEWLPSTPRQFPILYVAMVIAIALFAIEPRRDWWRAALLTLFAALAIRHIRNQPLFFAAFPILIQIPNPMPRLRAIVAYAGTAVAIAIVAMTTDHRSGVAPERFPVAAVARLRATGLQGNLYNADQFGGFLIWSFYPQRRVLTDGRNELYRAFIPEWQAAREDQRKWIALLTKYRIDLAVEEYRSPLNVIDARTGKSTPMDASLAYWPRARWALIAKDDAAMIFARRAAFPGIERWEIGPAR